MVYFKKLFIKAHVKTNVQKLLSVIVAIKKELPSPTASDWACDILFYKITKIVRDLTGREECLHESMDIIHGRGVKMFCFSRANHASVNLKKFSSSKRDKFPLFTHSSVGWNLENRYKGVSIFFRLSWQFKRARLRAQDFATGKNFSFNQCHNKEFCVFSRESYILKAIENSFPVFA